MATKRRRSALERMTPAPRDRVVDAFDLIAGAGGVPKDVVLEEWGERAAIREYLGGFTRPDAERLALEDVDRYFVTQAELF